MFCSFMYIEKFSKMKSGVDNLLYFVCNRVGCSVVGNVPFL